MAESRLMWTKSETGTPKLVERPQEPRIPSVDEVIERNDKQAAQQLQQGYKQAQGLIDKQIAQGRQAILNQYEIRRNDMKRKYDEAGRRATENTVRQAGEDSRLHTKRVNQAVAQAQQTILDQTMSAKSQAMAKIQALMDKHAPEKQDLDARMQAEVQKLTQQAQVRSTRLQAIRDLVASGIITDPAVAQQAEYKAAYGVDIPLSRFKQQGPSPEAKKAQLVRDIRIIDARLKKFTPSEAKWWGSTRSVYVDPFTGEERTLKKEDPEDAKMIEDMKAMNQAREVMINELQDIYIAENPPLRKAIEDTQRFKDAQKIIANGGNLNIEGSIRKKIGKSTKTIVQRNKRTGRIRVSNDGGKTWQIQ